MQKRAEKALAERKPVSLKAALRQDKLSCICEVKKASPSKGLIRADFQPVEIAKAYEAAGANAISCLTEEHYFQGSSAYLTAIRQVVSLPVLRKDFLDAYQVYRGGCHWGRCSAFDRRRAAAGNAGGTVPAGVFTGLEVLVEVHNQEELEQIAFWNRRFWV
ncbi:MAG: hypothetical protein ACLSFT_06990 [Ruminococcus callidus]